MQEKFLFHTAAYQKDGEWINEYSTRTWPYILTSVNWLLSQSLPGSTNLQNGLGLIVINETAAIIEGILTEIIVNNFNDSYPQKQNILTGIYGRGFNKKIEYYKTKLNGKVNNKIETYLKYESVEKLFMIRNHIAHGRMHVEMRQQNQQTGESGNVQSDDAKYQEVRNYLINQKIISADQRLSNVSVLWSLPSAIFFFNEALLFIQFLFSAIEFNQKEVMSAELNWALKNVYN